MSVCTPTTPTKAIPNCVGDLTVGTISGTSLALYFIISDITTGRTFPIPFLSDNTGLCVVDLSAIDFSDRHSYKAGIYKQDTISNPETITIGSVTTTEVELIFIRCVDDGQPFSLPDVTLEVM